MTLKFNELVCKCYFTNNYFIRLSNNSFHINYHGKEHFLNSDVYEKYFSNLDDKEINAALENLENERLRRLRVAPESSERCKVIHKNYFPLVPHVYHLKSLNFRDEFLSVIKICNDSSSKMADVLPYFTRLTDTENIYKIPIFKKEFCQDLIRELKNFQNSSLPKGRPNSMNNYGILLEELGFYEGFFNEFRESFLNPICKRLYPDVLPENAILDSQKAFIVTYEMGADVDLDCHFDNSEVTCNVSLDDDFTDGELYFQGQTSEDFIPCHHDIGHGVFHPGLKLHGSMPITSGTRHNAIIWMRSSAVRNQLCPMCGQKPDLIKVDGTGDGFSS